MLLMSLLVIKTPESYLSERKYILEFVIKNQLGLDYEHQIWQEAHTLIQMPDNGESSLSLADSFFQTPEAFWLREQSLPGSPLPVMNLDNYLAEKALSKSQVKVIYGSNCPGVHLKQESWDHRQPYLGNINNNLYLGIDVFGSAFFMLSRYEEYVKPERDQHDRFPAAASLAYKEGFLDRPIINEYIEILWCCMKRLWPGLERKKRSFKTVVSHDVDIPFAYGLSGFRQHVIKCSGDILKRKSPALMLKRIAAWQALKNGEFRHDPNYTFDTIMDISEQNNIQSAFYFSTACTNRAYDENYNIDHPYMRQLIRAIAHRGHEIGLHTSYETYRDLAQIKREFQKLLQVCEDEDIKQDKWGGRQHFLRWQVPFTWNYWDQARLNYDSTLSYAEHAGFRCGLCCEFPVYDLIQRKQLSLLERPLVIMDASVLRENYMGLKGQEAIACMLKLKQKCRQFKGDFTLLWHNSSFEDPSFWTIYENVIKG
jgi:peptidoglycan/xylan/chitin deacetylase (PgdA/CDA1 family)